MSSTSTLSSIGNDATVKSQEGSTLKDTANLLDSDLSLFARIGIPTDLLERAGIERVTDHESREQYGITGFGGMSGIVFPYADPHNGRRMTSGGTTPLLAQRCGIVSDQANVGALSSREELEKVARRRFQRGSQEESL